MPHDHEPHKPRLSRSGAAMIQAFAVVLIALGIAFWLVVRAGTPDGKDQTSSISIILGFASAVILAFLNIAKLDRNEDILHRQNESLAEIKKNVNGGVEAMKREHAALVDAIKAEHAAERAALQAEFERHRTDLKTAVAAAVMKTHAQDADLARLSAEKSAMAEKLADAQAKLQIIPVSPVIVPVPTVSVTANAAPPGEPPCPPGDVDMHTRP